MVPIMRNGPSSTVGGATWRRIRSNSGCMPASCEPSGLSAIQPCLADPYRIGKSSCSSLASSAANRSNTSLMTSVGRASGRSTLLITTIGFNPTLSAFGSDDQHQRAVHHVEDALDLAAEIGVAGSVDDVDAGVFPLHRGRLGQDGDAALALQIVGIHRALDHALVVAVGAGLLQQAIDQRGLAVVDVGDDGDVTKVHGSSSVLTLAVQWGHGWSAISPENRDPFFRITLKNWNSTGRSPPKKEARPKGPGKPDALRRNIVRNRRKT